MLRAPQQGPGGSQDARGISRCLGIQKGLPSHFNVVYFACRMRMTVELFRVCAQNTRLVGLAELALAPHEGSAVYLLWLRPR